MLAVESASGTSRAQVRNAAHCQYAPAAGTKEWASCPLRVKELTMSSILSMRRLVLGALFGAAGWAGRVRDAQAQALALDGRRFDGVFIQRGKTKGDADILTFSGGRFRSSACDRYGYGDAPYRTSVQGDAVVFEAETESPKYGKLIWRGTVRGDKLDATALMRRDDGKPPVENWVAAAASR
jgi:hypothetical protein